MLKIKISSLRDGTHPVSLKGTTEEIENIFDEFFGNITFEGNIRRIHDRYAVKGLISCKAKFNCDLSNEEFIEEINAELDLSFIQNGEMAEAIKESGEEPSFSERYLFDDDIDIDLSKDIGECLSLASPLKRIAPAYRGKDFSEIFPEYAQEDDIQDTQSEANSPWDALKNINLN